MQTSVSSPAWQITLRSALLDFAALTFIYLMPTLSHLLSFPLYYIEPMRLMVILAMMHTHRNNAWILALTLPLFSFVMATHPVLVKSVLIALELAAMVGIFYILKRHMHIFAAIFLSIWASKAFYYLMKYLAIQTLMPNERMIGIALYIQLIVSLALSLYVFGVWRYQRTRK